MHSYELEPLTLQLTQGDRVSIKEGDGMCIEYEYINQTDSGVIRLGVLDCGEYGDSLVGHRVSFPKEKFLSKLHAANSVEISFRESEELNTSSSNTRVVI